MFNPNHSRKKDKGTRPVRSHTLAEFAEESSKGRARGSISASASVPNEMVHGYYGRGHRPGDPE